MDEENPNNGAPHTNSKAKPNRYKIAPKNRKVIEVKDAMYRSAVLSGNFLVAATDNAYGINKDGRKTIEVECHWYDWRPKTRWIRITIINQETEIPNDSDIEIIDNIGI
jgi:hypothetical protein